MSKLSTKHVVLGLMIDRSSYGYGLQQLINQRLGFLDLADSVVYKTLERLEEDGLVEEAGVKRTGTTRRGAPRILYRATPEGVREFRQWMAAGSERPVLRDELHAKIVLSSPEDLPQLLKTVDEQHSECLAELAALGRPSLATAATPDLPWDRAARMMVDDFNARWLESQVAWLGAVSEVIEERIEQSRERDAEQSRERDIEQSRERE